MYLTLAACLCLPLDDAPRSHTATFLASFLSGVHGSLEVVTEDAEYVVRQARTLVRWGMTGNELYLDVYGRRKRNREQMLQNRALRADLDRLKREIQAERDRLQRQIEADRTKP